MPSFVGSVIAHNSIASGTQTLTPDFSGIGWSVGDLALMTFFASRFVAPTFLYPISPVGWYQLGQASSATPAARLSDAWYKILEGGDDETPAYEFFSSGTGVGASVVVSIWTDVDPFNPFDVFTRMTTYVDDATPTPDPITTITDDARCLVWMGSHISTSWSSAGAPSGYASRFAYFGTATYDDRQQFLADRLLGAAGTETPGDWTHSASPGNTEDGIRQTIALREPQLDEFPEVLDVTKTTISTLSMSHDIDMPSVVDEDDLLLLFVGLSGSGTPSVSGFTKINPTNTATTGHRAYVGYRVADGTEGGDVATLSTGDSAVMAAQVYRVVNYDPSNLPTYVENAASSADPPGFVVADGPNVYMTFFTRGTPVIAPSGYNWTERNRAASGSSISVPHVARKQSYSGTEDPALWQGESGGDAPGGIVGTLILVSNAIPGSGEGLQDGWGIPM